ncbi:MAG: dehydrogenase E1 component subunit alpha/beta [Armatimonadota bacterium]|nr:MAG: dehydrogenase E1 component subunit alpha/beta [Armatimonadota bacterium]
MVKEVDVLPDFTPGTIELGAIREFAHDRTLADEMAAGLTREQVLLMLERMETIRAFEEMIVDLKNARFAPLEGFRFVGATHLSLGQEGVAVGAMSALRPDDYITSTHRGHGHSIAKGAYAIDAMTPDELCHFLGVCAPPENAQHEAQRFHLLQTMSELLGKERGYCRGRGGGMHIADFNVAHLGANAIVGGSYGIAVGAALSSHLLGNGRVTLCITGDGAANNGICHEAYNFACMKQFSNGLPVIFLIENNQYGMTGQQVWEVTGIDHLARRGAGYNDAAMHAEVVNGMDALAVRDAVTRAAELCRRAEGPVLLECLTYRYMGHSLSDMRTTYRTKKEEEAWRAEDPIDRLRRQLLEAEVADEAELDAVRERARDAIREVTVTAGESEDPEACTIHEGLLTDTTSDDISPDLATTKTYKKPAKVKRDSEGQILYRHAIAEALTEEMMRDRRVVLYGEDVADYGGAFQVTRGLIEVFGRERVFDTAISEAAIVGTAAGAAMTGLRPVAEIMYIDFILLAMDQVGNQAAKVRYMFGGKAKVPMVVRTTVGGGKGYAGQHSQSLEAVVTMFPGLKVVAPWSAYDAKGLLKSAIRDDNPVMFIEHQLLYTEKGAVPEEEYTVPLGKAAVVRPGEDVTVATYSRNVGLALEAADMAAEDDVQVEVIDLRTLIPLDLETVLASVRKTGHLVLVTQAPLTGSYPQHVAYMVQANAWDALKAPMSIVAACDVPPPMAQTLETENLPTAEKIARAVLAAVGS